MKPLGSDDLRVPPEFNAGISFLFSFTGLIAGWKKKERRDSLRFVSL